MQEEGGDTLTGYAGEYEQRDLKPFEGKLVEIHSLADVLSPNEETQGAHSLYEDAIDLNGQSGRCLYWDADESKYVVQTFEGVVAGIGEDSLMDLVPPDAEDGGFDTLWPAANDTSYGVFGSTVIDCLATKGYCVVQMFGSKVLRETALEEAAETPIYEGLRAEMEEAFLGKENNSRVGLIEKDTPERLLDNALAFCDRDITNLSMLLMQAGPDCFGFEIQSRTNAIARTPYPEGQVVTSPNFSEDDMGEKFVEATIEFISRKKFCVMYLIENNGGLIEFYPKEHLGMGEKVELPIQKNRMVIFRSDLMNYSYKPQGTSVSIQAWLLDEPRPLQFRQLAEVPGRPGQDNRVHVTAIHERFPANCEGCDMTAALFMAGTDALIDPPYIRFDKEPYYMNDRDAPLYGKAYVFHGSFVAHDILIGFDHEFFGYTYEEAEAIAPAQRWVLEVGYITLHHAGWTKQSLNKARIGTFSGDSGSEWNDLYWKQDEHVMFCNHSCVTNTRIAHALGLTGPNVHADTACSASLVAANVATHFLRTYTEGGLKENPDQEGCEQQNQIDYALCAGILCMVSPAGWIGECASTMLSYRGRCFTYDSSADGFIRGEGSCHAFLERRHDDHVSVGSRSLAVLMGTAVNQDGKSASLTAPHGPSQQETIRMSLREAVLKPNDVLLTECHGTGTALGDPIEVGANRGVMFGKRERPFFHCTAKAHVGHEEANAGTCGLLKIVLMLQNGMITPNPHLRALNPHLDTHAYPIYFVNELSTMQRADDIYGVSSFGFGGTNSRADAWAETCRGAYKNGETLTVPLNEAAEIINRTLMSVGSPEEDDGFMSLTKEGEHP